MLTVHCSCVHIAVTAENVFCAGCETRNGRPEAVTSAAVPTAANGELASMVSAIALFTMAALIVGSAGKPLGPVGLLLLLPLPPHPVSAVATAASETV